MSLTQKTKQLLQSAIGSYESGQEVIGAIDFAQTDSVATAAIQDEAVTAPKISDTNGAVKVQRFDIGFADLNAAGTGEPALFGSEIPEGAIAVRTFIDVTEAFADDDVDASTIQIGLEDQDNDVFAADTLDAFAAGLVEGIQVGTMATSLKLTDDRQLAVTFTEGDTDVVLTAGSMSVFVEYVQST